MNQHANARAHRFDSVKRALKAVVIDGENMKIGAKRLGGVLAYREALADTVGDDPFIGTAVVVVRHATEALNRFLRFLNHVGLAVATWHPVRVNGVEKCADDVLVACEALKLLYVPEVTELVLMSGDSDLRPVAREARRLGKRITIAAFERSISSSLYAEADAFVALTARHVLIAGESS